MDKKKIAGVALGVTAVGLGVFKIATGQPQKYSNRWFNTVSDIVLKEEREKVRQQYCSAGEDFRLADQLWRLLNRFDNVIGKRAWDGVKDYKFPVSNEHGWYLPSDD